MLFYAIFNSVLIGWEGFLDELTEKVSIRFNSPQILDEKIFWAEVFCLGETENLQRGGGVY